MRTFTTSRFCMTNVVCSWPENENFRGFHKTSEVAFILSDPSRCRKSKLPDQDSNLDKQNQNLLCYRYTIGQAKAAGVYRMPL